MASGPRYSVRGRHQTTPPITRSGAITGRPPAPPLPGAVGAHTAAIKRAQGAGTPVRPPEVLPEWRCALDYLAAKGRDLLGQFLLNTQLHARRPSYIDPPLQSVCFDRHAGTGNAASGDPGIVIPAGGAPTLVADFTVPVRYRGVIKYWGVNVAEGPVAGQDVRWRLVVNGRRVPPFDPTYGAVAAGAGGDWAGPPFTLADPHRGVCINLQSEDVVQLQALNFNAGGLVRTVSARFGGWIYQPTVHEPGWTVRTTLTDQH